MRDVPSWPKWLGLAGLLPQFALVAVAFAGETHWQEPARQIGAIYGGLIFTFLGGTWWGIAAGAPAAERRNGLGWVWIAAVMPSLIALALMVASVIGILPLEPLLVMLGSGLLVALGVDARLAMLAPRWWMHLRAPLSLGLGAATLALAFA